MDSRPILIVEDERELADILGEYLRVEGFNVIIANDGLEGYKQFENVNPLMLLLDIMLPGMNGIEVCKKVRLNSDVPIIMLSAKNGEMDKVISLGAGADDYVTKPFSPLELVARVKAQLRRYQLMSNTMNPGTTDSEVHLGSIVLYPKAYQAYVQKEEIKLTTKEFEVLLFFAKNKNQVFSKEQIYEQVWGMNEFGDISSVAVYIKRIRKKLEAYGIEGIKTIWGVGYKSIDEEA